MSAQAAGPGTLASGEKKAKYTARTSLYRTSSPKPARAREAGRAFESEVTVFISEMGVKSSEERALACQILKSNSRRRQCTSIHLSHGVPLSRSEAPENPWAPPRLSASAST